MANIATTFPHGMNLGQTTLTTYQEGTWTPTIITSGTAGTPAYSQQYGNYTRIGNNVTLTGQLSVSSWAGSPTGTMGIGGIPFNNKNVVGNYAYAICEGASLTIPANTIIALILAPGSSSLQINSMLTGSGTASGLAVDTAFSIYFSITYIAA